MKYSESVEMYLETILKIEEEKAEVHVVDIAGRLKISKPSVTRALGLLRGEKLILQEPYGSIYLTSKGRTAANRVYNRHKHITEFLMSSLGLDRETAEADACRMEHIISEKTFSAIEHYDRRKLGRADRRYRW
jgi:DtxR family transcriptional regulator, Mn-dependent transcriptional regulator